MKTTGRLGIALLTGGVVAALGWRLSCAPSETALSEPVAPRQHEDGPTRNESLSPPELHPSRSNTQRSEVEASPARVIPLWDGPGGETAVLVVDCVRSSDGGPIPYAEVHVEYRRTQAEVGELLMLREADERGLVGMEVPARCYLRLWTEEVYGNGSFERYSAELEVDPLRPGETRRVRFVVPVARDLVVFGRVVDEGGNPVPGAGIWEPLHDLYPIYLTDLDSHAVELAVSGDDGSFEIWIEPRFRNCLFAVPPGLVPAAFRAEGGHGTPEEALIVVCRSEARLSVVVDGADERSDQLAVRVRAPLGDPSEACGSSQQLGWEGFLDEDGSCVLGGLPPDTIAAVSLVDDEGRILRSATIQEVPVGTEATLRWTLGTGTLVHGTLRDQYDRPVVGEPVWLGYESRDRRPHGTRRAPSYIERYLSTETDELGGFSFADVEAGFWWLGPLPRDRRHSVGILVDSAGHEVGREERLAALVSDVSELVEVVDGVEELEVPLRVYRGLFIRGRIFEPDGSPTDDAWIFAAHESHESVLDAGVEPDGSFAIGPLVPGQYRVSVRGHGSLTAEPITASAGDDELVIHLTRGAGVQGRLIDGTGADVLGSVVWLSRGSDPESITTSFAHGDTFYEHDLPEGTYDIAGAVGGEEFGLVRSVELTSGVVQEDVVIEVFPAARLTVDCQDRYGECYSVEKDGVVVGFGEPQTAFPAAVPAGDLVVKLWRFNELVEQREVALAVGESKVVTFD